MSNEERIQWFRSPLSKEDLRKLTERSDWKGFCQSAGYLSIIGLTGALSVWSWLYWAWYWTLSLVFLHGMVCAFSVNAMHELSHTTVFKNKTLNNVFLYLFSFIGWHNPVVFKASHTRHHQYTLHPPRDQEVFPNMHPVLRVFLTTFFDPRVSWGLLVATVRHAQGRKNSSWEETLFESPEKMKPAIRWARILLFGHGLITVIGLLSGWWIVPILVSLTPSYGRWLQYLCNELQHVGLPGDVPDWRVCARSVKLNPLLGFLYWHMQYHIEHHMYAAVPCYNLKNLNRLIRDDLPKRKGLFGTWRDILKGEQR